jgi:hypothetical protein
MSPREAIQQLWSINANPVQLFWRGVHEGWIALSYDDEGRRRVFPRNEVGRLLRLSDRTLQKVSCFAWSSNAVVDLVYADPPGPRYAGLWVETFPADLRPVGQMIDRYSLGPDFLAQSPAPAAPAPDDPLLLLTRYAEAECQRLRDNGVSADRCRAKRKPLLAHAQDKLGLSWRDALTCYQQLPAELVFNNKNSR